MTTVSNHEAKTHLSRLIERALAGEEIVIARSRRPVVRLVPVEEAPAARVPGRYKGRIWVADDFDELPEDLLEEFEGGELP